MDRPEHADTARRSRSIGAHLGTLAVAGTPMVMMIHQIQCSVNMKYQRNGRACLVRPHLTDDLEFSAYRRDPAVESRDAGSCWPGPMTTGKDESRSCATDVRQV